MLKPKPVAHLPTVACCVARCRRSSTRAWRRVPRSWRRRRLRSPLMLMLAPRPRRRRRPNVVPCGTGALRAALDEAMRTMRSFQTTAASVRALQSQKSVLCRVIDSPTSSVVSHCHTQETRETGIWVRGDAVGCRWAQGGVVFRVRDAFYTPSPRSHVSGGGGGNRAPHAARTL